ncbi:cAMP-binding domain of CRP or a regulatory subunit of cAMP-dependent protein kinases [Modicisalibacter ilicicola DSM 19980]|uniref:cAMP-binding domain of CRP or a regulatory subunit of cAMP-dependent protein kinases n=1 Tax=Modicisalibacter ilicicola DSM 19980 TaxID=1121942 RepID=A0A1M5CAU7_9GAMM|nr:Crp/Fnr family transcriptional regulator [Halomonas ilicicola]SHF51717.1 cAMP-binding domain of CRP or a regulatory subunit of cAMP-dependent protein kinases [Halomonas ilicicola DSM 19980]
MNPKKNAILTNLGRYFELTERERTLLLHLEEKRLTVSAGDSLWMTNEGIGNFFILQSGWAYTYRNNLDGDRQIVDVLIPGDIVGLREFTFARHRTGAQMLTRGSLGVFSQKRIVDLVEASTPLAIALLASVARQEAMLTERMLMAIHRTARSRIAHFIVEMHTRLSKVRLTESRQFYLPLTQALLGEILGLTTVHINRTLTALEKDRVLRKHRYHIEIIDWPRLLDEAEIDTEYLDDSLAGLYDHLGVADR